MFGCLFTDLSPQLPLQQQSWIIYAQSKHKSKQGEVDQYLVSLRRVQLPPTALFYIDLCDQYLFESQLIITRFFDKIKDLKIIVFVNIHISMKGSKANASQKGSQKAAPKATSWKDRISQGDYDSLKETFDLFDEDHGGTIDPQEIEKVMQQLGLAGRSKIVFEMVNGFRALNRPIKFDEFLEIVCSTVGDNKSKAGLTKVFNLWDPQGNGVVDFDSFKRIAKELGETLNDDEITQMMHNAYILNQTDNHDNFSFDEFYNIVTKKVN